MADFGFLSDTDDSAVDELISQAQDLTVLEQVCKINSFASDPSLLPSDLETRFRKLKSFPVSMPHATTDTNVVHKFLFNSKSELSNKSPVGKSDDGPVSDEESENFSIHKQYPGEKLGVLKAASEIFLHEKYSPQRKLGLEKESQCGYTSSCSNSLNSSMGEEIFSAKESDGNKGLKKKSKHGPVFSPSGSSNSWVENVISSPSKQKPEKERSLKSKSKSKYGYVASPLGSSNSLTNSPSPPRKTSCFWCSPKRDSKKKSTKHWSLDWGNNNDEFLSDLGTFSRKEQQKILRNSMKEEEKISKEAEKIVKWAKQASARMSLHGIDDDLSDDERAE